MTAIEIKDQIIRLRAQYLRGENCKAELDAAIDAYIAELKAYARRTKRRIRVPSRAELLRVL